MKKKNIKKCQELVNYFIIFMDVVKKYFVVVTKGKLLKRYINIFI